MVLLRRFTLLVLATSLLQAQSFLSTTRRSLPLKTAATIVRERQQTYLAGPKRKLASVYAFDSSPRLSSFRRQGGGHRDTSLLLSNNNSPESNDTESSAVVLTHDTVPQVYSQRWVQLAYLSLLALLSDWICFSVAAAPDTYETVYSHSAASLIDLFLFTNVASCFLVTDIVARIGLQRAIQGAAILMTFGCWLRAGVGFLPFDGTDASLVTYPLIVAGTVMVGVAQPFFQCTPPMLSALWFPSSERATSTAVALNFNQIGIATAFLVGGAMAVDVPGLSQYFGLIAVLCSVVAVGTVMQFQDEPPIPPSTSELEKKLLGEKEPPFVESVQKFFRTKGFTNALAAFVCSISITNIVGAFIDDIMERGGITEQLSIDLAGAGFELAILVGGIIIGGYVDKTKDYKRVTLACLAMTALTVIPLGLTDHALGKEPTLLLAALLGLGMSAGPVQPINAELAVDVTYPGDETAVESVQQIGGNMMSALLIPVAETMSHSDYQLLSWAPPLASDVRGDVVLLLGVALATIVYFSSFDAPLARSLADDGADGEVPLEEQLPSESATAASSSARISSVSIES